MQNETVPQLGEIHARLNSERVDADDTPNEGVVMRGIEPGISWIWKILTWIK